MDPHCCVSVMLCIKHSLSDHAASVLENKKIWTWTRASLSRELQCVSALSFFRVKFTVFSPNNNNNPKHAFKLKCLLNLIYMHMHINVLLCVYNVQSHVLNVRFLGNFLFAFKSLHRISKQTSCQNNQNVFNALSKNPFKNKIVVWGWFSDHKLKCKYSNYFHKLFSSVGLLCYHTVNFLYLTFLAVPFFKSLKCPIKSKYLNFQFLGTAYFSFCLPYFYNGDL